MGMGLGNAFGTSLATVMLRAHGLAPDAGELGDSLISRIGIWTSFLSHQSLQKSGFLRVHHNWACAVLGRRRWCAVGPDVDQGDLAWA
jgi:hypothetical protein